jgi:hypothetical protein
MKYTKLFNNHSEYEEYMASDNAALPNLSWCIQEDEGHFTPYVPETKMAAKFNVTSTSEPTRIISPILGAADAASSIEIDGVEQPSVVTGYTFSAIGEHTVKYTLTDETTFEDLLSGCNDVTDVTIPDTVTSIGMQAFNSCDSLSSCTIGNGVTSIGDSAFRGCTSLTSINIPDSVTSIGNYIVSDCSSLSYITVDNSNTTYDSRNNCNGVIEKNTNKLIAACKNTVIPSTVTSIGNSVFSGCDGLTSIDIPSSITSIGNYAFNRCSGLTSITVNATTPPTLGTDVFNNTNNCPIYVPNESVDTYKAASGWSAYASRIQGMGCSERHVYTLNTTSYPQTVAASATSFELSFVYDDSYTSTTCEHSVITYTEYATIQISENHSTSARTISGTYVYNGMNIEYSLTQEGQDEVPYAERYLTLDILTNGNIKWISYGGIPSKTISYSKNNGSTWTEITASSTGTSIDVSAGDKVLFKGLNTSYAASKDAYTAFGGTSTFNVYGNIMSLVYGDNFIGETAMTGTYNFCSIFKLSNVISAENLILPSTTLTNYCYRAMFSKATSLEVAPALPAETLAIGCYWYMFEECAIETAPDLNAPTLVNECYGHMFISCSSLNYIKCLATSGFGTSNCLAGWTDNVASSGTFIKDGNTAIVSGKWTRGASGIPTNWLVEDESSVATPDISFDGFSIITISCDTQGADIYYRLNETGNYVAYTTTITINDDTFIESYAVSDGQTSHTASQSCVYVSDVPIEYSNRDLKKWKYSGQEIETPYSVNGIDGHSSSYAKGQFTFQSSFALRDVEPTYLWFQHADQSAEIYIDNTLVEKHWGGYAAFTTDVSSYVHQGVNDVKVILKNNEGNYVAPASGDFNFNATLGNVRLLTSPYVPAMNYGYDGFHITSTVSSASATINVKTSIPTGATVTCTISGVNCSYTATSASTGAEMIFTTTITNPRLWNGTIDPYLYNVKLEISHNNEVYHRYERGYDLRYYEYVINDTVKVGTAQDPYTGFLLNGAKYLLRGCCMHDDIEGKANALNDAD